MKKYLVLISLELKKMKEYFLNVIMMISTLPVQIMIYIFMIYWLNEYQKLGEFKFSFFIMYYISILILKSIMMPAGTVCYYVYEDIRSGDLDRYLLLPISYIKKKYFENFANFIISFPLGFLIIMIANLFLQAGEKLIFSNIIYFFISALLGFTILFFIFEIVGILSFWFENTLSLRDIVWIVIQIFSGEMIPLFLLTEKFQFLNYLPISYIYYYPVMILQGKSGDILYIFLMQIIWIVVLFSIANFAFKIGVNKYESQGG